jgi:hypothetical protein
MLKAGFQRQWNQDQASIGAREREGGGEKLSAAARWGRRREWCRIETAGWMSAWNISGEDKVVATGDLGACAPNPPSICKAQPGSFGLCARIYGPLLWPWWRNLANRIHDIAQTRKSSMIISLIQNEICYLHYLTWVYKHPCQFKDSQITWKYTFHDVLEKKK